MKQGLVLSIVVVTVAAYAGSASAATGWWTVKHAQTSVRSMKLADGNTVMQARCHGTGLAKAGLYSTFRCTVSGQIQGHNVAANVDMRVTGVRSYRVVRCQTASLPLSAQVCP